MEQQNNKNNNKKFKEIVNVIKNDPQKKAWVVLAGYFIFFFIIIAMIRSNYSSNNNTYDSNIVYFNVEKIKNNNYQFKYSLNFDNNLEIYEGKKNNDKALFTKSNNNLIEEYYQSDLGYFIKTNGIWNVVVNPYKLSFLTDIEKIEEILKNSTYISKTEYNDSTKGINYQISTTTLVKLIDKINIDISDLPNDIFVTVDESGEVSKIELNLSSYTNYKWLTLNSSNIILEYSNINGVNEINDEINR